MFFICSYQIDLTQGERRAKRLPVGGNALLS